MRRGPGLKPGLRSGAGPSRLKPLPRGMDAAWGGWCFFPSTRGAGGAAGGLHLRQGSMRFAELTASYGPAPSVRWAELCEAHRWPRDAPWSRAEARATFRCGAFAVETAPTGDGRCVGWMVLFPSTRGAGGAAGGLHLRHGSMRFAELTASYGPARSVGWAELCEAHRWSREAPGVPGGRGVRTARLRRGSARSGGRGRLRRLRRGSTSPPARPGG